MTLFTAHFDESGTSDKALMTVAGCVSSIKKWVRFESEWNTLLHDAGLPDGTVFHMQEFAFGRDPYGQCFPTSVEKAKFFSQLVRCIRQNIHKAVSCAIALEDWERINRRYAVSENLGYPYTICGRNCVGMVMRWANKKGSPVEIFFEDGAVHRGQLKNILETEDGITAEFLTKDKMVQFQAADLLAWKNRKVLAPVFTGVKGHAAYESIMRSFAAIESIPHHWAVHDHTSLERICIKANIPRRAPER